MQAFNRWLSAVRKSCRKIRLVDRCLIVFMVILLGQSAHSLLVNEAASQEKGSIDVVLRTTAAAIFGYFLSTNFIKAPARSSSGGLAASVLPPPPPEREKSAPLPPLLTEQQSAPEQPPPVVAEYLAAQTGETQELREENESSNQQIVIATLIGIFALCTLILTRDFREITPAMLPAVTQMRDFVSGCVGFLLGSPGTKQK